MRTFAAVALLATSTTSFAQTVPAPAAPIATVPAVVPATPPAAPAMRQLVLVPNSEIVVTPNDTITTKGKQVKEGFKFKFSSVLDVMQDGYIVIPKGSVGEGTVTWMTNKGAFGKSGKMEVSFDWLEMSGRRIPLTGTFRQEGEGNTGATVGAVVAVGVFAGFVTGRSATIVNGQQLRARTVEPLYFMVPDNSPHIVTGTLLPAASAVPLAPVTVAAPSAAPAPAVLAPAQVASPAGK